MLSTRVSSLLVAKEKGEIQNIIVITSKYFGFKRAIMEYHGLSWTIIDYHGLSWTIMDYRVSQKKSVNKEISITFKQRATQRCVRSQIGGIFGC